MNELMTSTARIWREGELLRLRSLPASRHTLAAAQENMAALLALAEGRLWPALVDIREVLSFDRDSRQHYQHESARVATAAALLVGSPLSRVLGNLFLGLNRPTFPVALFTSAEEAKAWLRPHGTAPATPREAARTSGSSRT